MPKRDGSDFRNQMCAVGEASSMWPEDALAEQAVHLGLQGAVVDGLGLLDFTERPRTNFFGRRQANLDGVEAFILLYLLE